MAKRKDKGARSAAALQRAQQLASDRIEEQRRLDKREAIAGANPRGVDMAFPPDILMKLGWINQDMRDEGLRFAQLAWWLFGTPAASCDGLYARVATGGAVDGDHAPLRADDETDEVLQRILRNKRRFERLAIALGGMIRGEIEVRRIGGRALPYRMPLFAAPKRTMYEAVRNACQYLEPPGIVTSMKPNRDARGESVPSYDLRQMARLIDGLGKLVDLRNAEDRHVRRKHQPRPETAPP
jgi:hypothetical protein